MAPGIETSPGDGSIDLTVDEVDGALEYFYRIKKTSDPGWGDPVSLGTDRTITISDLENDTEYSIEAIVRTADGTSEWNDDKSAHVTPIAPTTTTTSGG